LRTPKELVLDRHPITFRLFYSKDDQGLAAGYTEAIAGELPPALKPDRILLAELRGEEAFDYLRNCQFRSPRFDHQFACGGAPSSPSSSLVLLVKQSRAGQELAREEIKNLLYLLIDCRGAVRCRTP